MAKFTIEQREGREGAEFAVIRNEDFDMPETSWSADAEWVHERLLEIRAAEPLKEAFSQITANMADWRAPISELIHPSMRPLAELAIPFMTGSVPTFEQLPSGNLLVQAAGYRAAQGEG